MLVKYRFVVKQKTPSKGNPIKLLLDSCFCLSVLIVVVILNLSGCAKMAPPQGGPIDKIPPKVISSTPVNDALLVFEGTKVEILFSEEMDRKSTEQALFLSPYDKMEMDWTGNKLQLDITLQADLTYLLTVGSGARDLRGNVLQEPFQLAFSTGSRLDPGSLVGSIYRTDGGSSTAEIFVYDLKYFSAEIVFDEPRYRTQCLTGGRYNFSRLAPGMYRIIAFEDTNRNGHPDREEWIAIPSYDVEVGDTLSHAGDLILAKRDKPQIVLERIVASHSRSVVLFFNESIDLSDISIEIEGLEVGGFFLSEDKHRINIVTEGQQAGQVYQIKLLEYAGKNISGENVFRGNGKLDVTPPRWLGMDDKNIFSDSSLKFIFSEAMENNLPIEMEFPYDEYRQYFGAWRWYSPNQLHFVPAQPWTVGSLVLNVKPKGLQDHSGRSLLDSILIVDVEVIPTYGSISGEVTGHTQDCSVSLHSELYGRKWETRPDVMGRFSFLELPPGSYSIWTYIDEDGDDNWNPGSLKPYVTSEQRVKFNDVINLDSGEHLQNLLLDFSIEQ